MNGNISESHARYEFDAGMSIFPHGAGFSPLAWIRWIAILWRRLTIGPEWEFYYTIKAVTMEDGSPLLGPVMRRRVGDTVQYRRLTPDEEWEIGWD